MKISVTRTGQDAYEIAFDQDRVTLAMADIKGLLMQLTVLLAPAKAGHEEMLRQFAQRLKLANDPGLQALLGRAAQDDVVVLVKYVEADEPLKAKLYRNMSLRYAKMCREDAAYRFKDGLPKGQLAEAMRRLIDVAKALEAEGTLRFPAPPRPASS